MMRVILDSEYAWKKKVEGDLTCWFAGSEKAVNQIVSFWQSHDRSRQEDLKRLLHDDVVGNFALIMEDPHRLLACVDKTRSYPVFYLEDGVSNSARALKEEFRLSEIDDLSLLEFRAAGYVTGRDTLYKGLYQLQAGEFLVHERKSGKTTPTRYYLFYSEETRRDGEDRLIEELEAITNGIFQRTMEEAGGAPIWVPLSGGFDSCLVLCKLKQLGYDNLHAFSYGAAGNYEAKIAREVAKRVHVEWTFVPVSMKEARTFFSSERRERYWRYSDGLSTIPNMQDIHALEKLREKRSLPEDAIIVNGQSGDFITGNHISYALPEQESPPSIETLSAGLIKKHFSLFLNLLSDENKNRILSKALDLVGVRSVDHPDRERLAKLYEWWEWQERQCKYVVNGQRIYDFLGLRWALPLWADEYLHFWMRIPLSMRYGQRLYRQYLEEFDFYGCFRGFRHEVWRWPGIAIAVVPIARMIRLTLGRRSADNFYQYAKYFGHYRQFYAPYGFAYYLKRAKVVRFPISLNIETWLEENMAN